MNEGFTRRIGRFDNWEEVPQEDLFQDGELTNEQGMIKAWDNVYYGKYKLIRRIQ